MKLLGTVRDQFFSFSEDINLGPVQTQLIIKVLLKNKKRFALFLTP